MTVNEFDKEMSAVAFAEAGEHETAKQMMSGGSPKPQKETAHQKKKPFLPTIIFGAISISAYVILFKNEGWVTETYTMGGWHTLFPVGTALFFSFTHGAFASNLLSVLGIEAKK